MSVFQKKVVKDLVIPIAGVASAALILYVLSKPLGKAYDNWITNEAGKSVASWCDRMYGPVNKLRY